MARVNKSVARHIRKLLKCKIVLPTSELGWHSARRERIQASDASKILLGKGYEVYADKIEPQEYYERAEWQQIKLAMEAPIAETYAKKYGAKVHQLPAYTICAANEHPFLGCTPDRLIEDDEHEGLGNLQIKAWSEYGQKEFAAGLPLYIEVQTQMELLAEGLKWGYVVVMFGSQRIERYFTEPNPYFLEKALPVLQNFWGCVATRTPPPVDGSVETAQALLRLHPKDNGNWVSLSPDMTEMVQALRRAKIVRKQMDEGIGYIENRIKAEIGDATYGVAPGGDWFSWKHTHRAEYHVEATDYRTLRECQEPKTIAGVTIRQITGATHDTNQLEDNAARTTDGGAGPAGDSGGHRLLSGGDQSSQ